MDLYCSLYDNLTPTCVPEGVGGLLYVLPIGYCMYVYIVHVYYLVIVCIVCWLLDLFTILGLVGNGYQFKE